MNPFIRLHPDDNVVIARHQLVGGTQLEGFVVRGLIPPGHKVATRALEVGQAVRRYNQIIGFASQALIWLDSQPRPTTSTPAKLAWVA